MNQILALAILAFLNVAKSLEPHQVYRLRPDSQNQIHYLTRCCKNNEDITFWRFSKQLHSKVDVMVSPRLQRGFLQSLLNNGIRFETYIDNVESLIINNYMNNQKFDIRNFNWTSYHNLSEIYDWMDSLVERYPNNVTIVTGGLTFWGTPIKGVKLSFSESEKPGVFIEGGIDPREWISPATVTFLINKFFNTKRKAILKLAKSYDWYFFPVFNPDGYVYTHSNLTTIPSIMRRLWSKNRSPNYDNPRSNYCIGAHLNTNWLIKDSGHDVRTNASFACYGGKRPFSEVESRSLSMYLMSISSKLFAYISIRGYGQELLFPYGYTAIDVNNYEEQRRIAKAAVKGIKGRFRTKYEYGSLKSLKGYTYGSSLDWVKDHLKLPLVYAYEMRDTGHGFLTPTDQIIPNAKEVMDSIIAMFKKAKKLGIPEDVLC